MTFAERMLKARGRAGISQEALAKRAGTTKANISKIELGLVKRIAHDTLFKIADVLQVSPRWLATGKEEASPDFDLRLDANKLLLSLPEELREPILTMIENAARAADTRYWEWVKEKEK